MVIKTCTVSKQSYGVLGEGDSYECNVEPVPPIRSSVLAISLSKQSKHDAHGNEETQGLSRVKANLYIL